MSKPHSYLFDTAKTPRIMGALNWILISLAILIPYHGKQTAQAGGWQTEQQINKPHQHQHTSRRVAPPERIGTQHPSYPYLGPPAERIGTQHSSNYPYLGPPPERIGTQHSTHPYPVAPSPRVIYVPEAPVSIEKPPVYITKPPVHITEPSAVATPKVTTSPAVRAPLPVYSALPDINPRWYYCEKSRSYYPYVKDKSSQPSIQECPNGWITIASLPSR